jgi:hypothetical protein
MSRAAYETHVLRTDHVFLGEKERREAVKRELEADAKLQSMATASAA